jgi:hypothetical protein
MVFQTALAEAAREEADRVGQLVNAVTTIKRDGGFGTAANSAQASAGYFAMTATEESNKDFLPGQKTLFEVIGFGRVRMTIDVQPNVASWTADHFVERAEAPSVLMAQRISKFVGPFLIGSVGSLKSELSSAIVKSVRVILEEPGIGRSIGSPLVQGASILANVKKPASAVPMFYSTDDSAYVAEFLFPSGRISCVFRDNYAHVMSGLGEKMTDEVYEGDRYQAAEVANRLNELLGGAEAK